MTPFDLLHTLRELDVHLTPLPDGEYLHVSAPVGALTDELREGIRQHKPALLAIAEWYDERASLLQYDAGLSRAEAEREAWKYIEERYGNVYG